MRDHKMLTCRFTTSHKTMLYVPTGGVGCSMSGKRVRVEFHDGKGGRYAISLNGNVTKEKVLKLMDLVELIGSPGDAEVAKEPFLDGSQFGKIYSLIEEKFPLGAFTSSELLESYEDHYNAPVKLSTVSTYLFRLSEKGVLARHRLGKTWAYKRVRLRPVQP